MPDFKLELAMGGIVAGIDEAGRGPLAGPVVAAAVILPTKLPRKLRSGLDDSKKVPPPRREELFARLQDCGAVIGVGEASVVEIDRINILRASLLAMTRAYQALGVAPQSAIVDGLHAPDVPCPVNCVVEGDGKSLSVAAASIVAKVTRDRLMIGLDGMHPQYGWSHNFGYGTPEHCRALDRFGPTLHHRQSFAPVMEAMSLFNMLRGSGI